MFKKGDDSSGQNDLLYLCQKQTKYLIKRSIIDNIIDFLEKKMEQYAFFKRQAIKAVTVAFGVAAMAAFYAAYANMFAEQQNQAPGFGF
jgi:hypothetical protein